MSAIPSCGKQWKRIVFTSRELHKKFQYASDVASLPLSQTTAPLLHLPFDAPVSPTRPEPFRIDGRDWRTSPAFDSYWYFAAERQRVFFNKIRGSSASGSEDSIIRKYRFTNAYRASDRVSQYLIQHVIYSGSQTPEELFFRILLFKLFNKIDTWELLLQAFGEITWSSFDATAYECALMRALSAGMSIYSSAYIMPSAGSAGERKHGAHLRLLAHMMSTKLPRAISKASTFGQLFALLKAQPSFGDFLAYQFATDLNYSTLCDFSEMEFVKPGPGALNGIRKCFPDLPLVLAEDAIRAVCETQADEFRSRGISFKNLWGRPLQLIDCQNLFCEIDKYSRVAHPELAGISQRTRIKQVYRPSSQPFQVFYPPKWKLDLSAL